MSPFAPFLVEKGHFFLLNSHWSSQDDHEDDHLESPKYVSMFVPILTTFPEKIRYLGLLGGDL